MGVDQAPGATPANCTIRQKSDTGPELMIQRALFAANQNSAYRNLPLADQQISPPPIDLKDRLPANATEWQYQVGILDGALQGFISKSLAQLARPRILPAKSRRVAS
jgi:hypothetical protein